MPVLPPVPLGPRLRAVPDIEEQHGEIHAGALTRDHVGRTIAVRTGTALIVGPLVSLEESALQGKGRLVLRIDAGGMIGQPTLGLHPSDPVIVLPDGYMFTVTAVPRPADQ